MILRRIANGIKNQDWFVVLIEIFIVVIGIYIGLQVDDWQKERQDRQVEHLYLQELLEDLQHDRDELNDRIGRSNMVLTSLIGFLEQAGMETPTWSVQNMNENFDAVQRMPTFIPSERAFTNITGSGDFKIIRNRELKNALAVYYAEGKVMVLIQNTHEMELVQNFQPYIIEHMDYQAVYYNRIDDLALPPAMDEDRILELYKTREFRNIITQKWVIMTDILAQFRIMKEHNDTIIEILENEIGIKLTETQERDQQ